MPKNNYTKVEEALDDALLKMKRDQLLQIAGKTKGGPAPAPTESSSNAATKATEDTDTDKIETKAIKVLHSELQQLYKDGKDPYKKLGINKVEITKYIEHPEDLTPEDWNKIKQFKEQVEFFKKDLDKVQKATDDEIIEDQIKKQKTKRFNVKDNWLPL